MKNVDAMMASGRIDWQTPPEIFEPLHCEFNFTIDAAAAAHTALVPRFWSAEDSAFDRSWAGERVWCNPPYGAHLPAWIAKMAAKEAELVVGFVPARTDTRWFHNLCLPLAKEIRFLRGRVRFVGAQFHAPFPSMLVVW